ncbi:MAG: hypothetical protein RL641_764 [Candidatus Parcubacteria bacterium]|jgi:DNA processing protein
MLPLYRIPKTDFPARLLEIPHPPKELYARGFVDLTGKKVLTVVGPRKHTSYGRETTHSLILSLRGLPVVVVSGLAHGIDSIAHEAALEADLPTIAFPGSGLDANVIYPAAHRKLAERILENDGMLISEFKPHEKAVDYFFPQRNRLVAGISHAVLIPEAGEKSGTLITAKLTVDYNRDLLVVPGNINSPMSKGANQFLRLGATPITCADDLREALGFARSEDATLLPLHERSDLSVGEKRLLSFLIEPLSRDELIRKLSIPVADFNMMLTMLEIKSIIREENGIIFLI